MEFSKSCDPGLPQAAMLIRNDSAYLLDLIAKFSELNLSLQGNEISLTKVKSALSGFNNKLTLYQRNLGRRDFFSSDFFQLQQLDSRSGSAVNNADIDV